MGTTIAVRSRCSVMVRMENRRYYRQAPAAALIVLTAICGSASSATAQTPLPSTRSCDELKRDPQPAWAHEPDSLKPLTDCGYTLNADGEYATAQRVFALALELARQRKDRRFEAIALDGDGLTLGRLGQIDRAEPLLQDSLRISEELDDKDGMAEACSQLGHLRTTRARYEDARAYHLRSFALWESIGKQRGMAVALNNVGATYQSTGDYVAAAEYYQRSLDGLEQLGDRRRSATVIDNLARIARTLGDYAKGLELSRRALEIRTALDDREGIARSQTSLSESYRQQGNYTAALAALRKSLDLYTTIGVVHSAAETLNNIAVVYEAQGNYALAADFLRKSLALNDAKVGSASLTAEVYTHLGEVFFAQGDSARATQSITRSLSISARAGFKPQAADARLVLGRVATAGGQLTQAATALADVLRYRASTGDRAGRAEALVAMAEVDRRRGRFRTALAHATEARDLADAMELVHVRWPALTAIARAELALGRTAAARRDLDRAIDVVEDLRLRNPGSEETRRQFFADHLAPYRARIELALATGQTAEAFHVAERSKARALLDAIRGDQLPVTKAMTAAERSRETSLRTALNSANSEVSLGLGAEPRNAEQIAALKRKRDARRLAYEEFQSGLYAAHPELQGNRAAAPVVRAAEAQRLLPTTSAAIVEFVAGQDRTHAFVITTSGIRSIALTPTTAEIGRQVGRFRDQLAHRDLRASESARQLYELVLGPMRASLRGITELVVVPDGPLWNLPFNALEEHRGHYLIEDVTLSYAPSVTVLREAMRRRPDARSEPALLAFGNPAGLEPLPETEKEVTQAGATYGAGSRIFVGADASEDRWKAEAPHYAVLHLATHGVVDNASPMYSHLALARPALAIARTVLLEAWEIMNMPLHAAIVVLSACDTAQGRDRARRRDCWTDVGRVRRRVASRARDASGPSSQPAPPCSSARSIRSGAAAVACRRRARCSSPRSACMKTPGFEHPFYWAGFMLGGDGR